MIRSLIATLLFFCASQGVAQQIEIPKNHDQPFGCVLNQPVFAGWHTAGTLTVEASKRKLSLATPTGMNAALERSSGMSTDEWLQLIAALENEGFRDAKMMIGTTIDLDRYFLGIALAYEHNDEWRCHNLLTGKFPEGTTWADFDEKE